MFHLRLLSCVPKACQQADFLCFMGKHTGKCGHIDVTVSHPNGPRFALMSAPSVSHPIVSIDCWKVRARLLMSVCSLLLADVLWNLAMAINVYMTLFRNFGSQQLKSLEWRYHLMCYGSPFLVALVPLFIRSSERGRIYGPATVSASRNLCLTANNTNIIPALVLGRQRLEIS